MKGADGARGLIGAATLAFGPLLVAAAATALAVAIGTGAASGMSGGNPSAVPGFQDVVLLPADGGSFAGTLLATLVLVAGGFGVFVAPGLLILRAAGRRLPHRAATVTAAVVLSTFAVALAWVVAQGIAPGLAGRSCLYLTVAVVDGAALALGAWRVPGAPAWPREGSGDGQTGETTWREVVIPAIAVALLIAAVWIFMPGKFTTEALEGDATEVHGFAASLAERALPSWDLESGAWGFYPTFMFVAYPVWFTIGLVGDCEAAVRLPALFFLGLMMFASADLAARGRARVGVGTVGGAGGDAAGGAASVAVPMFAVALLSAMVGAYYAGYHPFHGDLGCSPVEEWMVTGFAMAAFLLLEAGAPFLAALAALLSVLTFPSGLMFAGLVGVAGLLVSGGRRRDVWKFGFGFAAMALAYAVLLVIYTKSNGSFDAMIGEWYEKYFQGRARFAAEPWLRKAKAAGWFALLAGGLPALGMLGAIVRGDRVARHLGLLALLWVAFFVMSPNKNVHYFMPAALLPMAATLRWLGAGGGGARDRWVAGVLTGSALAVIALCRPASVPPYVADREFGRKTLFLAGSEREAVDYSQILFQVSKPLWHWEPGDPWTIGHHTWVMYAERGYEPRPEHEFFVGQGPPPVAGLKEITRLAVRGGGTVTFWARDGRASLRTWREKTYPLRQDLSRFSFEMSPYEEKP